MTPATRPRLFLGTPGFEPALCAEIRRHDVLARPNVVGPGLVAAADGSAAAPADFVFARQQLPSAVAIAGASIGALADAAFTQVEAAVDRSEARFALHAFAIGGDDVDPGLARRASLIGSKLSELFAERRRRAFRRLAPSPTSANEAGWDLVQVFVTSRDHAWASVGPARALPTGGTDLSPFPGGIAPVTIDRTPPSRAYLKLEEALRWMDAAPAAGETCVDLGAAPGSWSLVAARRGARVVAVDRAPLEKPAAGHANITAVIGNALTHAPDRAVDWLLCDVICEPHRTVALVDRWLAGARFSRAVVTIKFKGRAGYGVLADLPPLLGRHGVRWWRCKQLAHNKNEVTLMIRR